MPDENDLFTGLSAGVSPAESAATAEGRLTDVSQSWGTLPASYGYARRSHARRAAVLADRLREMMSRYPTGVAIVTCLDPHGTPCGMTCSSLVSVCLDPPTLLVCLRTASATSVAIGGHASFAVNLLDVGGRDVAQLFSSPIADRFVHVRWQRSPGGQPWLVDHAVAVADCSVVHSVAIGDHTVVFGEVVDLAVWGRSPPLLYGMRRYADWATEVVEDGQCGESGSGAADVAAAGDLDTFTGVRAVVGFVKGIQGGVAVDGDPEVRPADPPVRPGRDRSFGQSQREVGGGAAV